MKFNKENFDLMSVAGGVAGGIVAKFVEKVTVSEDQDNNYLTIAVQAVAGAALSAFVSGKAIKAAGAGMVGVAGYNLAKELNIGSEEAAAPATSGLLPSQLAIGAAPINRLPFQTKAVKGTEEEKEKEQIRTNVQ